MTANLKASSPVDASPKASALLQTVRRWVRRTGIGGQIVSLIIVVAVFAIGTRGKYLEWANLQVILSLAGIPVILAIGLHQAIILGAIDLSVEGVAGLAIIFVGMLNGLVYTKLKIPSFIGTPGMSWTLYGIAV